MGVNASYQIGFPNAGTAFDVEAFVFHLGRGSDEAMTHIDRFGRPTGNDGSWGSFVPDMQKVSRRYPDLDIFVEVTEEYDGTTESRYYFRDGKYQEIHPVITWPEPSDDGWQT